MDVVSKNPSRTELVLDLNLIGQEMLYCPKWNPPETGLPVYPPEDLKQYTRIAKNNDYYFTSINIEGEFPRIIQYLSKIDNFESVQDGYLYINNNASGIEQTSILTTLEEGLIILADEELNFFFKDGALIVVENDCFYIMITVKKHVYYTSNKFPTYDAFLEY